MVVAAPISACVIPAGPEFQDPTGTANESPRFLDVTPTLGSVVTSTTFSVLVADPNVGDHLRVRWLADFPPTIPNSARTLEPNFAIPSSDNSAPQGSSSITIGCTFSQLAPVSPHRIMAIVADREFATDTTDVTAVSAGGLTITATWVWNVTCPPQ